MNFCQKCEIIQKDQKPCPRCGGRLAEIIHHGELSTITPQLLVVRRYNYYTWSKRRYLMSNVLSFELTNNFWRGKNYSYLPFFEFGLGIILILLYIFPTQGTVANIKFFYLLSGIISLSRSILAFWNLTRKDVYFIVANIKQNSQKKQKIVTIFDGFEENEADVIAQRLKTYLTP